MSIKISPEKTSLVFGIIAVLFVVANLVGYTLKYVPQDPMVKNFTLVNLDIEGNLPTYFSSILLLLSGLLLGWIAAYKKKCKEPFVVHWAALSILFVCMSIDESASIHELLIRPLRSLLDTSGFFYHAWVIPGICLIVALVFFYARFVLTLRSKTRLIFIVAGATYIMGVIGVEMIGGNYISLHGADNLTYGLLTTLEETFEMLGIVLFVYGLMDYGRFLGASVQIDFA